MLTPLELEVAQLLVTTLRLEDPPDTIPPETPLFVDGLGLDSIDALEIALAISKTYGFEIKSDDADNRRIFANLRALAGHVERHRAR
jgi:acyl carrier protein